MARAYVLGRVESGRVQEAKAALQQTPGVRQVDIVSGEYDLVIVLEAPTPQDLGRIVLQNIHGAPGMTATTTYVVVG